MTKPGKLQGHVLYASEGTGKERTFTKFRLRGCAADAVVAGLSSHRVVLDPGSMQMRYVMDK